MRFVEVNNGFTIDLYHQLSLDHKGENIFVSPYSVASALLMLTEGARGETAAQMGQVLRFPSALRRGSEMETMPWEMAPLHEGMAKLNARLRTPVVGEDKGIREEVAVLQLELQQLKAQVDSLTRESAWPRPYTRQQQVVKRLNELLAQLDQYEIRVANAMWCEKTYPLRSEFVETIDRHYETSGVFAVDFKSHAEESRRRINGWVAEQTHSRITDLLPAGMLNALTRLVITNAIYFRGEWIEPFEERWTKKRDFFLADGGNSKTLMMEAHLLVHYAAFEADGSFFDTPDTIPDDRDQASGLVKYPGEDGFAMLELPYKGDQISMVLIAPNRHNGLPSMEQMLTSEGLQRWIQQLRLRQVHVRLPKFRLERDYSMAEVLQRMGMVRAFENRAQFAGITSSNDLNDQLQISVVLHKALVEVNEKGTEAAAATSMVIDGASLNSATPFTPIFWADRPFVFMIQDRSSGAILFIGRMTAPDGV